MLNESSLLKESKAIYYEVAKLKDIYLLQGTLKKIYGKSPWNYAVFGIELANKKNNLYLKMYKDKEYVGFLGLRISGCEAHITNLAILPAYQNQGLGGILLKSAISRCEKNECLTISLEVKISNKIAINLYRKNGFFQVGIKEKYYRENQEDAIDMILVLDD